MASRSKEKADAAIKELQQQTGKEAIFLELDLSSLASVRKAAEEFLRCVTFIAMHDRNKGSQSAWWGSKESELHVLFNNVCV